MGDFSAKSWGAKQATVTLDDSVKGVLKQVGDAFMTFFPGSNCLTDSSNRWMWPLEQSLVG